MVDEQYVHLVPRSQLGFHMFSGDQAKLASVRKHGELVSVFTNATCFGTGGGTLGCSLTLKQKAACRQLTAEACLPVNVHLKSETNQTEHQLALTYGIIKGG